MSVRLGFDSAAEGMRREIWARETSRVPAGVMIMGRSTAARAHTLSDTGESPQRHKGTKAQNREGYRAP
ncbi:MAG: hypothetical protein ABI175_20360, partial [Polyangiales bacterium]